MTEKENLLKAIRGEQPEWVPIYWDAVAWNLPLVFLNKPIPGTGNPDNKFLDVFGFEHIDRERYIDIFGVDMTFTIDGAIPTPGIITMTDITKWREQLTFPLPDLDEIDFEGLAEGFYSLNDHDSKAVAMLTNGVFIILVNAMGFEGAMCAMYENPEACHEFFQAITDWEEKRLRLSFPHFKPDIVLTGDDVAAAHQMFMSPEMYAEMIAPYHKQIAETAIELGAIVEMHCCGKCESVIPQWIDMGVKIWQPAQQINDLHAITKKYGNKLIINGGWDTHGPGGLPGASEEVVRQSVRDTIDKFAADGNYIFWDGGMTGGDYQKFEWTVDEARKYGRTFYKK